MGAAAPLTPQPARPNREIERLRQLLMEAWQGLVSQIQEGHSSDPGEQNEPGQERQSNRNALTAIHELLARIIEAPATPLLLLDGELRVTAANPAFLRAFRASADEVQGLHLYSVSNGAWDIPRLRAMLEGILQDHNSVKDLVISQDFPDVGHRILTLRALHPHGFPQTILAMEDITDRSIRKEQAEYESEDRFRNMADAAPVLMWVSGADKACTFLNKSWLAFTGRTMQQELGHGWAEGVHPEDLTRCLELYTSSFTARRTFQMEYRLRRWDGEYRWVLDNGVPRFERGGVFVGYIGSCVDVTDVKTAHEENLAKQKLETVGAIAGGIAHDFNNLLGGIMALSEVALSEVGSGSSPSEELQKIRAAAMRGAEIVRQLMIYAGQETEVAELVDVAALVQDMLELLRVSVSKHVRVETAFGEGLPLVRASPTQIRQVAMNLITNASEAIGDRDGVIRVAASQVTLTGDGTQADPENLPAGNYLQLEISDTGRGMTPQVQSRIFDPFFTTKSTGSHGQGLVVVQRIVQSLYGRIRLVSAPGKGATFQVQFPAESRTLQSGRSTISTAGKEAVVARAGTVLIVDDEDLLRQAVSKKLRRDGLFVLEASDGTRALDLIRSVKEHIDVLLLDVTLPGAHSRDVYKEAKRLRPGIVVIVTSAKSAETAAASLGMSIEHFLRKPFRFADLLETIQGTLASTSS